MGPILHRLAKRGEGAFDGFPVDLGYRILWINQISCTSSLQNSLTVPLYPELARLCSSRQAEQSFPFRALDELPKAWMSWKGKGMSWMMKGKSFQNSSMS